MHFDNTRVLYMEFDASKVCVCGVVPIFSELLPLAPRIGMTARMGSQTRKEKWR